MRSAPYSLLLCALFACSPTDSPPHPQPDSQPQPQPQPQPDSQPQPQPDPQPQPLSPEDADRQAQGWDLCTADQKPCMEICCPKDWACSHGSGTGDAFPKCIRPR